MGKIFESISPELQSWIENQKLFFVATAPLSGDGHINCSPKGLDSFRVLDPYTVAYQDLTGSGIETIAHLQENQRITIMFCAFEGPPKIVRLQGKGEVITQTNDDFEKIANHFQDRPGTRAYIVLKPDRISDSCGYAVPLFEFKKERDVMDKWIAAKGDAITEYRKLKNKESIDSLKGLEQE